MLLLAGATVGECSAGGECSAIKANELESEGYPEIVERRWDGGGYAAATGKGDERLREERLFG